MANEVQEGWMYLSNENLEIQDKAVRLASAGGDLLAQKRVLAETWGKQGECTSSGSPGGT